MMQWLKNLFAESDAAPIEGAESVTTLTLVIDEHGKSVGIGLLSDDMLTEEETHSLASSINDWMEGKGAVLLVKRDNLAYQFVTVAELLEKKAGEACG